VALAAADLVVVFAADLERDHQVLSFMIKRNLPNDLQLVVIDPRETALDKLAVAVLRPAAGLESLVLKAWLKALAPGAPAADVAVLAEQAGLTPEAIVSLTQQVAAAQRPVMVFDQELLDTQPEAAGLLRTLAQTTGHLQLLDTWGGPNRRAAAALLLDEPFEPLPGQAVFIDLGDDIPTAALIAAVKEAPFLVVQASYHSPLTELADVVLPVETWLEQSGHYLNLEGRWQLARAALAAPLEVRSNVAVLAGLAARLNVTLDTDWLVALNGQSLAAINQN
jgi:NADH dehydrogenase/NADH:ubiquinone oxidoreductase subunit G